MKILLVRHSEPDYSIDSLTHKGWHEAELLADRLAKLDISDYYCSPLGRAKDTAKSTMARSGAELKILPWLREFSGYIEDPENPEKHMIPWNLPPQFWSRQKVFFDKDKWLTHPFMTTGNILEVLRETHRGIDDLLLSHGYVKEGYIYKCENNTEKTIVLFCHFAISMTILSYLMGVSNPVMWQGFFMPASSVTTLVTEERVKGEVFWKCMQLGDTSHLYAVGEPVSKSGLFPEIYTEKKVEGSKA